MSLPALDMAKASPWVLLAASGLAWMQPGLFAWATAYTAPLLGAAMFAMGLTLSLEQVRGVLKRPGRLCLGLAAQFTIMPAAGWLLAVLFELPDDLALGVILVGCMPGGTASNLIAYVARGDVAYSVLLTAASTLAAPLASPLLVALLGGAWVDVPAAALFGTTLKIVLLPVLLGCALRACLGDRIERVRRAVPCAALAVVTLLVAGILAVHRDALITAGPWVLLVVALHNAAGLLLGHALGRAAGLGRAQRTALAIEVGMQNSGLAIALASAHFPAQTLAALPGAVYSLWHNLTGLLYARAAGVRQ